MTMIYTQLTCLWVWLILIIIYDPIGYHHYTYMSMFDIIYQWGNTNLFIITLCFPYYIV